MNESGFSAELEDICKKYERLSSLVCILQILTSIKIGIESVPGECLSDALLEIELEMHKTNNRLKAFVGNGGEQA